jgi:hypothetical protein
MFCKNCGQQLPENVLFCPNCGAPVSAEEHTSQENNTYQGYSAQQDYSQPVYTAQPARPAVENRNIATAIILSLITCGIYGIYWLYTIVRDVDIITGNEDETTIQFILCAFVPFYSLYWLYTRDKRLADAGARYGVAVSDNAILFLILALCELDIISWALLQNDINNFAN